MDPEGRQPHGDEHADVADLERRVVARTAELAELNRRLHDEIADRRRTEQALRQLQATLEQRVEARTAELRASHAELAAAYQELEAFSYSVSHDLRAPLRHIHGFAQMLKDHAGPQLDATSLRYLDTVAQSAQRLGRLVDDLLEFARMGRQELAPGEVHTDRLVQEVLEALASETVGRNIQWRIEPLPVVHGDASLLRQVWWNLLANAVKYTQSRDVAVVQIRSRREADGQIAFCVEDNGVGFDMRYVGKLFGVFQRLHRMDEFEGAGIGLAHVRRIVQRHGGRTWAEGVLGQGATFSFSLPDHAAST